MQPDRSRHFLCGLFVSAALAADGTDAQIRTALELRSLSSDEAERGLPVELSGVVVFSDPPSTVFFQDETAGAFFQLQARPAPAPGDDIRVRGVTYPGLFLPGIKEADFEVTGHSGLPEAVPVAFEDLLSGRHHYQHVAVEGVVRTVAPEEEGASLLRLDLGVRVVAVRVQAPPDPVAGLVDARVRVAGLAAGELNQRRQLVEPYLRCRDWSDFEILSSPRTPASTPVVAPAEILNFSVGGSLRHRVRVVGTVLAAFPGGELFLRGDDAGVGIRLLAAESAPEVGERVEIVGFPEMDRFSARLADALLVSREPGGEEPAPWPVALSELRDGRYDSQLVAVEGGVEGIYRGEGGATLTLRDGASSVRAEVSDLPRDTAAGAWVRVEGIAVVESARRSSPYSVEPEDVVLRLRAPRDLAVLRAPTWWTDGRLAVGLFVCLVATILAGLWIAMLRRQVALQTATLRRRIEHEAALEERQRLAREFHDTLEQQLAGLSLRLDAATAKSADETLSSFLKGSRRLLSRIQSETRNLVSDLRQDPGETADLVGSLTELLDQDAAGAGPELSMVSPASGLPPLPSRTAHHLRMIAQESVTNAIKHAEAKHIVLSLAADANGLAMTIRDDGRGFDAEAETSGKPGHFGCMGIRERCRCIGAKVEWISAPGEGSTVVVALSFPERREGPP